MKTFADFAIDTRGKTGEIKTTCPQCSAHRKKKNYPCLNVNTDKGVWHCWHCDWKGSLKEGVEERSNPYAWKRKEYTKPEYNPTGLPEKVLAWFKGRGITQEVLLRNKIGYGPVYMPQIEDEVNAIQFPFFRGGKVVNIKYRDGLKNFRMVGGAERILYGLDDLEPVAIVVEGEMDKLALEVAGFTNVLSVPDGAPPENTKDYSSKFDFLDSASELLEQVKAFVLAVDNDGPGKMLEEELARRLGREKCSRVSWPQGCKDANDTLMHCGAEVLKQAIQYAQPYPIKGLYEVLDVAENLDAIYRSGFPKGEPTGWKGVNELYSVAAGQWTLVTGVPSHGKSEWLDALAVNLADRGWVFGVCSPENQPITYHAAKLLEKRAGKRLQKNAKDVYEAAKQWVHEHFKFILPEEPSVENVLELAAVLVKRYGINGLIVDPWNELDHSRPERMSETEYISHCLSRIRAFARKFNVHVWLVAHPTKLQKDRDGGYPVPTPYDVSGSAHWRNKADNCIAVWRDVQNENAAVEVHIQKVRFRWCGKAGMANLHYDLHSGRYFDIGEAPPIYSGMGHVEI